MTQCNTCQMTSTATNTLNEQLLMAAFAYLCFPWPQLEEKLPLSCSWELFHFVHGRLTTWPTWMFLELKQIGQLMKKIENERPGLFTFRAQIDLSSTEN